MTKTNEFRIEESEGVFSVQRKFTHLNTDSLWVRTTENWHSYYTSCIEKDWFLFNNHKVTAPRSSLLVFQTIESAKEFIDSVLKSEKGKIEDCIYHTYP